MLATAPTEYVQEYVRTYDDEFRSDSIISNVIDKRPNPATFVLNVAKILSESIEGMTFLENYKKHEKVFYDIDYSEALKSFQKVSTGLSEITPNYATRVTEISDTDECLSTYIEYEDIRILFDVFYEDGIIASVDVTKGDEFYAFEGTIERVLQKIKGLLL